ncbi:MAG TPA: SCO family protein [Stellaceae bacterium]|nr:SCO family protein [Stellaceae bacterium]
MRRKFRYLPIALLSLIALCAVGFAGVLLSGARPPLLRTYISDAIGGPFTLVANNGQTVTDRTYRGKWLLVFFGYTHCPDVCPTTLNTIATALRQLGPEAARVQPLFITVDPARDTPQVLTNYVKVFDPRIVGLTGTPDQIAAAARAYRVYFSKDETAQERDYQLDHSAFVYLMNPQGKFVQVFGGAVANDKIAARLRQLIGRQA